MRHRIGVWVLLAVVSAAVSAAAWMVAMRVEVRSVEPVGERTRMVLTAHVAPEDRSRIGPNGWMDVEIRSDGRVVQHASGPASLAAGGAAQLEVVWPPGTYQLWVRLEGVESGEVGVWQGSVEVPELSREARTPVPSEPASSPTVPPVKPAVPSDRTATAQPRVTPTPTAPQKTTVLSETAPAPTGVQRVPPAPEPTRTGGRVHAPTAVLDPSPAAAEGLLAQWAQRAPGLRDMTVLVLDSSRPVQGLGAAGFEVRVDGDSVQARVGDGSSAPVHVVLAVDLSQSMADELLDVRRALSRLAVRAQVPRGATLVLTADQRPRVAAEWGATPETVMEVLATAGDSQAGDLAGLVAAALEALDDRRGRRFVVLVTDGGATSTSDGWREAEAAARTVGATILQVRFPSDEPSRREQRVLTDLTEMTGGKSYVASNTDVLELAVEHFATLISGSYVLAVPVPAGQGSVRVKVDTAARGLDVLAPRFIGPGS